MLRAELAEMGRFEFIDYLRFNNEPVFEYSDEELEEIEIDAVVLGKTKVSYNFSYSKSKIPQAIIRSKVLTKDFCGLCAGTGQID